MTTRFGKRRGIQSVAGGGRVGTGLGSFLTSYSSGVGNSRSAAEWAADVLGRTTGVSIERSAHRKISRRRSRLTKAVESYRRHTEAQDRFNTENRKRARKLREETAHEHGRNNLSFRSNPAVALISGPFLLTLEAVVLVAELTFYYYMFSGDLRDDASFIERAMVIVLSLFVPVTGIAAARFFAAAATATRGHHSKMTESKAIIVYTALLSAALFLAVVCGLTFKLVAWRYTGQSIPGLPVAHPPANAMATLFAIVILINAGIRGFIVPIAARSDEHLRRAIRADRRREKTLANTKSKALASWTNAWTSLETAVNVLLDDIEKALSAADIHLLVARAQADPHAETTDNGLQAAEDTSPADSIHIAPRLNLPHVNLQLRLLDAALTHLDAQRPPLHTATEFPTTSLRERLNQAHAHLGDNPTQDAA